MTATDAAFSWNTCRNSGTGDAFAFAEREEHCGQRPVDRRRHLEATGHHLAVRAGVRLRGLREVVLRGAQGHLWRPRDPYNGDRAWIVDSFDPTSGATLSANPNWWRGSVPVQRITVSFFSSETSMALAMRAGEIDYAMVASPKSFAATSGAPIVSTPSLSGANLSISTVQPGWNDVHVRQAVAYALNRSDIIQAAGGYGTPWTTEISAASMGTIGSAAQVNSLFSSINEYSYNLAKAKQEMALSAYPQGFSTTLLEFNYGDYIDCSEVIVAELAKMGIKAQIKVVPTNAWSATEFGAPGGRLTTFAGIGEINNDPAQWVDYSLGSWNAKSGGQNISEWDPPTVDTLVKDGIATSDNAKRFAIYAENLAFDAGRPPLHPPLFLGRNRGPVFEVRPPRLHQLRGRRHPQRPLRHVHQSGELMPLPERGPQGYLDGPGWLRTGRRGGRNDGQ